MLKIFERTYKQTDKELRHEFPNCQFVMRVDSLTDNSGYLLAVSTSPESSSEFGDYLEKNADLEYLYVCGNYSSNFIGGSVRFGVDDNNCYVQCVYNCSKPRLLSMLFDTGAVCTTIRIDNIQGHPVMPTGRTSRFKTANETLILLQEITVQQFTVGNIDMGRCFVWTAPQVENLLGLDLLSKLNWEYSADTGLIEITKPVDGSGVTDAVSCVKEFCAKHNVPISVLTATFPDSWEKLTRDEIETLSLFTYNNILHRG